VKPTLIQPLDCLPPVGPSGFKAVGIDMLGAAGVYALLGAAGVPDLELAGSLRGDLLVVYDAAQTWDDTTLAVWRLRFDSAASAHNFASAIDPLKLDPKLFDHEVALSVSSDSAVRPIDMTQLKNCSTLDALTSERGMNLNR
jgi:hypothetical protein